MCGERSAASADLTFEVDWTGLYLRTVDDFLDFLDFLVSPYEQTFSAFALSEPNTKCHAMRARRGEIPLPISISHGLALFYCTPPSLPSPCQWYSTCRTSQHHLLPTFTGHHHKPPSLFSCLLSRSHIISRPMSPHTCSSASSFVLGKLRSPAPCTAQKGQLTGCHSPLPRLRSPLHRRRAHTCQ